VALPVHAHPGAVLSDTSMGVRDCTAATATIQQASDNPAKPTVRLCRSTAAGSGSSLVPPQANTHTLLRSVNTTHTGSKLPRRAL